MTQGVIPEAWTAANIVSIPKPLKFEKFSPFSLTPIICKMLERILFHRLLYRIGKLDPDVNGFVQHRSARKCQANYACLQHEGENTCFHRHRKGV